MYRSALFYLLLMIALALGCQPKAEQQKPIASKVEKTKAQTPVKEQKPSIEAHLDSTELAYFNSLPLPFKLVTDASIKDDSIIAIETDTGMVRFVGRPSLEEYYADYVHVGYHPTRKLHILEGSYWEESYCELVVETTGQVEGIWEAPIFSPNDSLFISKSMEYGLEGVPNGFMVYALQADGQWKMIKEVDQQEWVPLDFRWISNNEIMAKTTTIEAALEGGAYMENTIYFKRFKL